MLQIIQTSDSLQHEIQAGSVDLLITSPSNALLAERTQELFAWAARCLSPDGIFIVEATGMFNDYNHAINRMTVAITEKRVASELTPRGFLPFYDLYKDGGFETYYFYSPNEIELPKGLPYRKYNEREMSHLCEFDSLLISELIRRFSNDGETVLDPFCGTGIVPRQAFVLGRNGIGIDRRCPFTNKEIEI